MNNRVLDWIIYTVYPVLPAIYLYITRSDYISLVLSGFIITSYLLRYRKISILMLNTIFLYFFGVGDLIARLSSIPYILIYPLLVSNISKPKIYPTGLLGPLSRSSILLTLFYMPAIFLRPSLTLYYTIQYIWILIISLYSYLKIRHVIIKDIIVPKNLVLNRPSRLTLSIDSPESIYIYIDTNWGEEIVDFISGSKSIELDYTPSSIGSIHIGLKIYALDRFLLSSRRITVIDETVNVSPFTLVSIRYILRGLGEILARAGLPRVIGLYGAAGGGGEGSGIRGRGLGEMGLFRGLLAGILGEYPGGLSRGRRRSQEYYTVREFIAGDEVRDIHWKKSVSRRELYVKEYSGGGGGGGGSGLSLTVIADFQVSNVKDLDEVTNRVLLALYSQTRLDISSGRDILLILISPYNEVLYVRGSIEQVLGFYIRIFQRGLIKLFYNYVSVDRYIDEEYIYRLLRHRRDYQVIRGIDSISISIGRRVLHILNTVGYGYPTSYTLINSGSSILTSGFIKWMLSLSGYRYVELESILQRIESPILVGG